MLILRVGIFSFVFCRQTLATEKYLCYNEINQINFYER